MIKKIFAVFSACVSIVVVVLCMWQKSDSEYMFPLNTSYFLEVNFAQPAALPEQTAADIHKFAKDRNTTILTVKSAEDDAVNGRDIYRFGNALPEESGSQSVPWFTLGRHGKFYAAEDVGRKNLTGRYNFYSRTDMLAFKEFAEEIGGVTGRTGNFEGGQIINLRDYQVLASTGALFVLFLAVIWSWIASRRSSQMIRLLNGGSFVKIGLQDLKDFCRLTLPIGGAGLIIAICAVLCANKFASWQEFAIMSLNTYVLTFVGACFSVFLLDLILHPRIKEVASRKSNYAVVRWGDVVLKTLCLSLIMISIAPSIDGGLRALNERKSVEPWRQIGNAVSLRTNDTVLDPETGFIDYAAMKVRWEKQYDKFFSLMASQGKMFMSYKETSGVMPNNPNYYDPSEYNISEFTNGRYTDVVFTDKNFINLFNVNRSSLKHIDFSNVPQQLQGGLKKNALKLKEGMSENVITDNCYEWDSSDGFPSLPLSGNGDDPIIEYSSKPLVVLFDNPAEQIDTWRLTGSTSFGRVFFTDSKAVEQAVDEAELNGAVVSILSFADMTAAAADEGEKNFIAAILFCALACGIAVLCVVESSKLWALGRKKMIFVMRTAGDSWASIQKWHLLSCGVTAAVLFAVGSSVKPYDPLSGVNYALVAFCAAAAYLACEFACGCSACRQSFVSSVHRQ